MKILVVKQLPSVQHKEVSYLRDINLGGTILSEKQELRKRKLPKLKKANSISFYPGMRITEVSWKRRKKSDPHLILSLTPTLK
jgi:hypothetical protein